MTNKTKHIVVFDGVCNFCNGAVNFIIKHDPTANYIFTPMQSKLAQTLITAHEIPNVGIDTFLLVKNGQAYIWTNAALEIAKDLDGIWRYFYLLKLIPRAFRDMCYRPFARNRLRLFGKRELCIAPAQQDAHRFIGV